MSLNPPPKPENSSRDQKGPRQTGTAATKSSSSFSLSDPLPLPVTSAGNSLSSSTVPIRAPPSNASVVGPSLLPQQRRLLPLRAGLGYASLPPLPDQSHLARVPIGQLPQPHVPGPRQALAPGQQLMWTPLQGVYTNPSAVVPMPFSSGSMTAAPMKTRKERREARRKEIEDRRAKRAADQAVREEESKKKEAAAAERAAKAAQKRQEEEAAAAAKADRIEDARARHAAFKRRFKGVKRS